MNGLEGSIERTPTSRSAFRSSAVRAPISVLLPTPGGPVMPTIRALPVRGKSSATSRSPSASRFSTRVIARARARLSPARRRSASESRVEFAASAIGRQSRVRPSGPPDPLPGPPPHADARLRAARAALRGPAAAYARRLALADGRPAVSRQAPRDSDRQARQDPLRSLRMGRRRDQDPLPRGRGDHRGEDGAGTGVHDLRLPARADRRAVRDRRPGDVHRLRPRDGRGRAADPNAGHLQARRGRRLQRLDRLRRLRPARRQGRRQRR